jgi:hypothetical protein
MHLVDWPHSLFTSLRVYVMADKFGVLALKLLAREGFYRNFSHTANVSSRLTGTVQC